MLIASYAQDTDALLDMLQKRGVLNNKDAAEVRSELAKERDLLTGLIGPGPAADLQSREDDAHSRLGVALVHRDEPTGG